MERNEIDFKRIFDEGKRYLKLELNYNKLTAVEKLAVLLSAITYIAVIAILCTAVLFYLVSTLVVAIAKLTGHLWVGNLSAAALLLIAIAVVAALRHKLITDPITRFITKLLLNPDDDE